MSTGIELSMFLAGTVRVMKDSLPTRCAWILSTAAGMRTIGASGGRILVTLLHEMRRRDAQRGLATLCVGGGQGQAAIIRNGRGTS